MEEKSRVRDWFQRRSWLRRPTKNDVFWLIVSIVLSLFLWVYIATTISGTYSLSFSGIPVIVNADNSRASGYGLSVLSPETETVKTDVTVSGSRASIGGLSREDIEAYVDFNATAVSDNVGRQELPVRLRYKNGTAITNCTLSVPVVDVEMDKFMTKEVLVSEAIFPNVDGANDEVIVDHDNVTIEPSVISITGPSTALKRIDHVRVHLNDSESLSQTKIFTNCTEFDLIDADRTIVTQSAFHVQATQFSVKVPVYYIKKLPATIALNAPVGFDEASLMKRLRLKTDQEYTLPQYGENNLEIIIRTDEPENKASLDKYTYWQLDTVSLSQLSLGGNMIRLEPEVKEEFEIETNLDNVYLTMDETGLVAETRWIPNSSIDVINEPPGYDCTIPKTGSTRITIIGTPEEVAKVTTSDMKATVNLFNATLPTDRGTFSHTLTVTLPDTVSGVWVSSVTKIFVTAVPTATTTTANSGYSFTT